MGSTHNSDDELIILDVVDHSIVSDAQSPCELLAEEFLRRGGPWILFEQTHGGKYSPSD